MREQWWLQYFKLVFLEMLIVTLCSVFPNPVTNGKSLLLHGLHAWLTYSNSCLYFQHIYTVAMHKLILLQINHNMMNPLENLFFVASYVSEAQ